MAKLRLLLNKCDSKRSNLKSHRMHIRCHPKYSCSFCGLLQSSVTGINLLAACDVYVRRLSGLHRNIPIFRIARAPCFVGPSCSISSKPIANHPKKKRKTIPMGYLANVIITKTFLEGLVASGIISNPPKLDAFCAVQNRASKTPNFT